VMDRRMGNSI